jgi:hypothetical protein
MPLTVQTLSVKGIGQTQAGDVNKKTSSVHISCLIGSALVKKIRIERV